MILVYRGPEQTVLIKCQTHTSFVSAVKLTSFSDSVMVDVCYRPACYSGSSTAEFRPANSYFETRIQIVVRRVWCETIWEHFFMQDIGSRSPYYKRPERGLYKNEVYSIRI